VNIRNKRKILNYGRIEEITSGRKGKKTAGETWDRKNKK